MTIRSAACTGRARLRTYSMFWGVTVLAGLFVLALLSAVLLARRWNNVVMGVVAGFAIGVVGWFTATMLFWYFNVG